MEKMTNKVFMKIISLKKMRSMNRVRLKEI